MLDPPLLATGTAFQAIVIEVLDDDSRVGAVGELGVSAQTKYETSDSMEAPMSLTASILIP
jgi:hypothetical protein